MRSLAGFRIIVFKGFLQFQIFSNTVRMHSLETLFKKNCIVFKMFYAVPNRLKSCHCSEWFKRHCFRVFSLQFQIVSNTIRMHVLKTLVSNKILHFPICSNTVRMHALEILFSNNILHFLIFSNTVRVHVWETLFSVFSVVPNRVKYRQNAFFRDIVFKQILQFHIVSNTVRMHALETLSHHVLLIWSFGNCVLL